ncbi:MAG TPA: cation-translocating P-type ATPase [Bryobacteraceae bacterium]|nr:cation-translocating P-type ATPase [Bryobacteraceae bacterium]
MPTSLVLQTLRAKPDLGLTTEEAAHRLQAFGPNELPRKGRFGPWAVLWRQFRSVMVLVLVAATLVSLASGDYRDAAAILVMILLTALLGFRQEYRAERGMAALERLSAPSAHVRRSGRILTLPARGLVPGDIVLLEAGSIVPGDVRLLETHAMSTDESALTGESQPVGKDSAFLGQEDSPLGDRLNMAYMGTLVTSGRGLAVITATGQHTEMGRISSMLQAKDRQPTPLEVTLNRFGRKLVLIALLGVGIVFATGLLRGEEPKMLLLTSISLAVAAVPEGLPAVITILLALGSQRMLKRRALIRRLAAVETLGSVTVICSDKTGTLTENHLKVTHAYVDGQLSELSGGTQPEAGSSLLSACAALSNDVVRTASQDAASRSQWYGDPTEVALVEAAEAAGIPKEVLDRQLPREYEVPFDSNRKRMTTVHRNAGTHWLEPLLALKPQPAYLAITKGAIDALLPHATRVWTQGGIESLTASARETIRNAQNVVAARGMRVIGVAFRTLPDTIPPDDALESDLIFLGFLAMTDPPRPEAKAAVELCKRASIRPVMITGDHALTAQYIAAELGIGNGGPALTSAELRRLPSTGVDQVLDTAVIARASPEDKLVLIEALQGAGEVVAMTGDGVNDAPALARADVGVAMGQIGTDAAREASDVVLQDDNFATIVAAVEEGRVIRSNIRKFIRYMLSCNSGELWVVIFAPLLGMPLPLTPLQILWINFITDGFPALALAVEPAEPGIMNRPPRGRSNGLLEKRSGASIFTIGFLFGVVTLGSGYQSWQAHQREWQTIIFTVLTFSQLGFALACRSESETVFRLGWLSNPSMLYAIGFSALLQAVLSCTPLGQFVFGIRPLGARALVLCLALSAIPFCALEIEKWLVRRRAEHTTTRGSE